METITITIQQKKPYTGSAETHPEGDFYSNGEKYTCWDPIFYSTFKEGDNVSIEYTEKSNEYNGKTYINKNISKMVYAPVGEIIPNEANNAVQSAVIGQQQIQKTIPVVTNHTGYLEAELVSGRVKIGNSTYEVILRLVDE